MKKYTIITVLVLLTLLATIGTALASESKTVFRTRLSGEAAGTGSDAHGNAVFMFKDDGSQVKYKLVVNGLEDTLQAHIHVAPGPGLNGPIVLWLYPDQAPFQVTLIAGIFNGLLGSRITAPSELTGAAEIVDFEQLQSAIEEGRAYVNVHTVANTGGEIRGTIH